MKQSIKILINKNRKQVRSEPKPQSRVRRAVKDKAWLVAGRVKVGRGQGVEIPRRESDQTLGRHATDAVSMGGRGF
jgi:hypothetical protein